MSAITDPLDSNRKETFESFTNRITTHLSKTFSKYPPFTIVRFSEILQSPQKHYSTPDKFLRALENVIQVSSSIAEFPDPNFDVKLNGEEVKTNGKAGMVPVSVGSDDSQTIFLTKVPWLTEEDIKEIESEHYLLDEYPINDAPLSEEYDHDEQPLDNEQKKRALEEQKDSPEKKHKPSEAETENQEVKVEANEETKEENPTEDSPQEEITSDLKSEEVAEVPAKEDTTIHEADESTNEVEPTKEDTTITEADESTVETEQPAKEDTTINEADETLDEDKMDINTTLEEDKMDLD